MPKLNLNKPSHVMLAWAGLTITGFSLYALTKNEIYLRRREHATPYSAIPTKTTEISWEEKIAQDEANAAKKGYNINYRDIHRLSEAKTAGSEGSSTSS
ncbi:hypothetical protein BGZ65_008233 [Modicella reniformis]|uniref:Uncharacterized protein n=1 Tax=Modicella reniformis TaxID=1440133 RepID=A0A9P6LXB1_9FUNG|nr:hypothetical protein BGZ65_008233 [Modicella reniformis]